MNHTSSASALTKETFTFSLTVKEWKLIETIRQVQFGKLEIVMQNGQPDRVNLIRENVKL